MKNLVFRTFVALFCLPFIAESQTYFSFSAGLLTTPCVSTDWKKYESTRNNFHNSFTMAASIEKYASKVFSFGLGINYDHYSVSSEKSWYSPMGGSGNSQMSLNSGYLAFFIYPQFGFGKKLRFYFNFGPYVGFPIHTHKQGKVASKYDMMSPMTYRDVDEAAWDIFSSLTLSVMQSLGLDLTLGEKWSVFTEFNFRMGISVLNSLTRQMDLKFKLGFRYKLNDKRADLKTIRPPNYWWERCIIWRLSISLHN